MIKYDRLWQTMKQRGVSQYDLYTHYNVNRSQLNRLRHNENRISAKKNRRYLYRRLRFTAMF